MINKTVYGHNMNMYLLKVTITCKHNIIHLLYYQIIIKILQLLKIIII